MAIGGAGVIVGGWAGCLAGGGHPSLRTGVVALGARSGCPRACGVRAGGVGDNGKGRGHGIEN